MAEEQPPPVPPKDTRYSAKMNVDSPPSAPASGSKRKRQPADQSSHNTPNAYSDLDADEHTPKRTRTDLQHSEGYASDEATPAYQHNVRRKKGSSNLSIMNLRHAAAETKHQTLQVRESKFQEGSLTDKPSEKPPSVFTRLTRTESGNILKVEGLMENYHDGISTPRDSLEAVIEHEKAQIPHRVAAFHTGSQKKDEEAGLFRFGRQFAANFHPVTLWNKLWNESKEELRRENMEAERKAQQKAEAERKYAHMKREGQFQSRAVTHVATQANGGMTSTHTPRDSGIVIDGFHPSLEYSRGTSFASQVPLAPDEAANYSSSELLDTATRPARGLHSRLHFKKPSLQNIKSSLKRVASDLNLAQAAGDRDSSSSVSPTKADFAFGTLRKSQSKVDLKKQQKLSKRVSNLELKLQNARKELDAALVEASPMPTVGTKYSRFAPMSMRNRPTLRLGALPTLPSERVLMSQQNGFPEDGNAVDGGMDWARTTDSEASVAEDDTKDETIKARGRQYPRHAADLFDLSNEHYEEMTTASKKDDGESTVLSQGVEKNDGGNRAGVGEQIKAIEIAEDTESQKQEAKHHPEPDTEAANATVKTTKRATRSKKRKSGIADADKSFRPDNGVDEDSSEAELERTPRKKRKSARRSTDATQSPPTVTAEQVVEARDVLHNGNDKAVELHSNTVIEQTHTLEHEEDAPSGRNSIDSQGQSLEPVFEEDEEVISAINITIPLNEEPSRPTAKATPARYTRSTFRARSTSPHKRSSENQTAGKIHSERSDSKTTTASLLAQADDTKPFSAVPGEDGVPKLPSDAKGSNGSDKENAKSGEASETEGRKFEWPDDVF